ncbi:Peptidase M16 inactive domain protein [Stieleria maiorica]|uniref:Peptidase M16 inactive domain protein n=1 Tax=Stieleria maiorica TaxID=2795974 RepID=A0A5B9MIR9_9BACT|nr:pitrilysin family protein [Stieleria maiorica]QEG01142.1 Peptidase M16 inactive domain protein [Stieleria maiorica]
MCTSTESAADDASLSEITTHRLPNGMTVLVQPMPWLRTAAFTLSLRGGIQNEPAERSGLASMVCEMVQRGAGSYSSRDLVAMQDNLGMDRNSGVSTATVSFGAAMPAESFAEALKLYADIVRRPHLPGNQIEDARLMMIQELRAIEDEPTQRVMKRVRELHYGPRLGRGSQGTMASLAAIDSDDIRQFYQTNYHAGGAILTVAGRVEADDVMRLAEQAFGDWRTEAFDAAPLPVGTQVYEHVQATSSQTHIAFAFPSIPYGHPDYFAMRAGIGILSDGMSSRLFDRVREKRGLCYTVSASCHSLINAGGVFGYAGTTPARAQETLDVTLGEIRNLPSDLEPSELDRWKVRIESGLIMEQESSASRASSLASDFYQIGRAMPTAELSEIIESLTLEDVRGYWENHPPSDYRIVTLGPEKLAVG